MFTLDFEGITLKAGLSSLLKLALQSLHVPQVVIVQFSNLQSLVESDDRLSDTWSDDVAILLSDIIKHTEDIFIIEDSMAQSGRWKSTHVAILRQGIRACVCLPIKLSNGELWGTVAVLDNKVRQWTDTDICFIQHISNALGTQINAEIEHQQQWKQLEALKNSEYLFQQLADTSTDALIIMNADAYIVYCNHATEDIFGYSLDELINQSVEKLTDGGIHGNMEQAVMTAFNTVQGAGDWKGIRVRGRHKNGSDIPIELSFDVLSTDDPLLFKLIVRDVSRQVMIEEELRANATRYLQILDAIPDLVYVKNAHSQLVWANKAFERFFDMPLPDLIGKLDTDDLTDSQRLQNLKEDESLFISATQHRRYEESMIRHDGNPRQFITTKTPILNEEGRPELLVAVSTDITDAKNLECYLTEALEKNHELITLKSDFISMVSHEFRTPLAVIQSSADILTIYYERLSDEKRFEKMNIIRRQVSRLTKLMNDVLLVSKGDAGGMMFKPALCDVHALAHNIIEEVTINYQDLSVSVNYNVHDNCREQVIDSDLFRHIVQNLLSNAIKYSRPDTEVLVGLTCSDGELTLVVTDRGIGIPAENQENLFQTFHRANNVGTIQGTGLGLSIVKRAVDTHKGSINFRSIENEGTMFVVKLPVGDQK